MIRQNIVDVGRCRHGSSPLRAVRRSSWVAVAASNDLDVSVPGGRSEGSLTWAGLGNTYFWIDPAKGIAGVILMQLIPFADAKALALYDRFEKAVYAGLA